MRPSGTRDNKTTKQYLGNTLSLIIHDSLTIVAY
jgi:hypothetical protein